MKTKLFLVLSFVMLLCVTVFAANPSYSNFDTWYFSIVGNTVKINTNNIATRDWVLSLPSGSGSVTNFSAGGLSPLFTSSVATPTTFPALTFSAISQNQNLVYASPNGSAGVPGFRAIVPNDIPTDMGGNSMINLNLFQANTNQLPVKLQTTTDVEWWQIDYGPSLGDFAFPNGDNGLIFSQWSPNGSTNVSLGLLDGGEGFFPFGVVIMGGTLTGDINGGTNASPALATNNAAASDGYVLSKTGNKLKLIPQSSGGGIGIDVPLTNVPPYSEGTNFYIDFSLPSQTWHATNFALRYSTNWPSSTETSRFVSIFIPPTNITRRVYVYNDATNWQTAGLPTQLLLAANQGAMIRAGVFGQGETNVMASFVASRSVSSLGETFFNPLGIPGMVLWLDAGRGLWQDAAGTTPVTVNGQSVRRWDDQSGNSEIMTNGASTATWNQFGANNSNPSVHFSGIASFLKSSSSNVISQPMWVFVAFARSATNAAVAIMDNKTANSGNTLFSVTSGGLWSMTMGTTLNDGTILTFNWQIFGGDFNQANSIFRTNGAVAVTGTTGTTVPRGYTIGGNGTTSVGFNGDIAEILVWSANLTAQNITDIELYLNTKYSAY